MDSITAVFYVKDERAGLRNAILSVRPHVEVVLVWDTGSTDGTLETVRDLVDRTYQLKVPLEAVDFGEMETFVTHLAKTDWALKLDGDEMLSNAHLLHELTETEDYGAWRFPRKRWADLGMTKQLELEAWPDWQYRFMLADGQSRYVDAIHPRFESPHPVGETYEIWLDHFVDIYHLSDPVRVQERTKLYQFLANRAGKAPEGSPEAMRLAGHG